MDLLALDGFDVFVRFRELQALSPARRGPASSTVRTLIEQLPLPDAARASLRRAGPAPVGRGVPSPFKGMPGMICSARMNP